MPRPDRPPTHKEVHGAFAKIVKGYDELGLPNLDSRYLRESTADVNGRTVQEWYDAAQRKGFFGYKSIRSYMKVRHGATKSDFAVMNRRSDEETKRLIGQELEKDPDTRTKSWMNSRGKRGSRTPSRHSLYKQAAKRGFFGYPSWHEFIGEEFKIGRSDARKRPKEISDAEIHNAIGGLVRGPHKGKAAKRPAVRLKRSELLVKGGEGLTAEEKELKTWMNRAANRKAGGKGFFGYGSWAEYLEKKHGVTMLDQTWSDERVMRGIALHLEREVEPGSRAWDLDTERPRWGRSRSVLYQTARLNGYYGYGSWPSLLEEVVNKYDVKYSKRRLQALKTMNRKKRS